MGGGDCLFGIESVYRGKYSIVEVASNAVKTELPDMGTWKSGTLNVETRCFDLLCTGKCDLTMSSLKLNVESSDRIPNFFTKNGDGKVVFSSISPMSIITTHKGHGTWIQIELKTINGVSTDSLSGIAKHVCLGIKKRSEIDYFDVIHAAKLTSEYVDLFDTDAVELVPLLSKTEVTSNPYEIVKPGDEITPSDFGLTGTSFDFGSVYRVNIKDHGAWIEKECNLSTLENDGIDWANFGNFCTGPITASGEKQILLIKNDGKLACSRNGIHWTGMGNVTGSTWYIAPTYGNGVWCIAMGAKNKGIKYSIDGGSSWSDAEINIGAECMAFGNDIFMTADNYGDNSNYNKIYTSPDAKIWTEVGRIQRDKDVYVKFPTVLIYGDGKWICSTWKGVVYSSKDGKIWEHISSDLFNISNCYWFGGCYANGYFYVVNEKSPYIIARSKTGKKWTEFSKLSSRCHNITYYENRLYSINAIGTICYIGIPNP